jgi:hypothetical protein
VNRNLTIALLVAIALGLAGYFVLRGDNKPATPATTTTDRAPATSSHGNAPPAIGSARGSDATTTMTPPATTPTDSPQILTPFQRARARAMADLQNELTQRIAACAPAGTAPQPRPIRLILEHRPEASAPEKQQFLVKDVVLLAGNADNITPQVRSCIDQLRGMPVVLFVNTDALPSGDPTMDETFQIPLP